MYPAQETSVHISARNHLTPEFHHNVYNLGQNKQRFLYVYCKEVRTASQRFVPFSMNGDQQIFTGSFNEIRDKLANSGQIAGCINASAASTHNSIYLENFQGMLPASRVRNLPVIAGPQGAIGAMAQKAVPGAKVSKV